MSGFGDYLDEMDRIRTSAAEIERLLSGAPAVGSELQPVADLFAALRAGSDDELADDLVAGYVTAATSSVGAAPVVVVAPPRQGRSLLLALRRRAATVAAAAVVFFGGTTGLAMAADGAKPGDFLYGVDRAFEAIGIGAGAEQERLSEAEALVDTGEIDEGLEHAAEALEEDGESNSAASAALLEAATRVSGAGADPSTTTRERVAGLLTYLSENIGEVDGARVTELATQIGGPPDDTPANPPGQDKAEPGPPDHTPANPPGQDKAEPGPPDHTPANPPGQDKAEPGPPGDVPADPPGLSNDKPGRPDPPSNTP